MLPLRPTPRALAIAEGLVRTGRATRVDESDNHIVLRCKSGGFYWIAFDGARVLRGAVVKDTEQLQSGFVAAMERAGSPARGERR